MHVVVSTGGRKQIKKIQEDRQLEPINSQEPEATKGLPWCVYIHIHADLAHKASFHGNGSDTPASKPISKEAVQLKVLACM